MKMKKGFALGLSCMMILANCHIEAFAADIQKDDLKEVLHLTFENQDATDSSARGNHGDMVGDLAFVDGPNGKALHIVNTTGAISAKAEEYVDFGTIADLQFGKEDFTISYLYQAKSGIESGGALISNKDYDNGGNTGFAMGIFSKETSANFRAEGGARYDIRPLASQLDEDWHHVVVSYDRDGNMSGYLDGVKVKDVDISSSADKTIDAFNFVIGADGKFANSTVDASIDEVRVFRSALNEAQALQLKEEALPEITPPADEDEILHLTFDDGTAKDSSGLHNDGEIAGAITFEKGVHGKAAHIVNENGNTAEVVEQYINLGNHENIHLGESDFTVTFWYRGLAGTEDGGAILSDKDYSRGTNKGFAIGSFTNEVRANFADGSNRKDNYFTGLDNGSWHHSAVTFDRDGNMSTYTDGEFVRSVDISSFASIDVGATDLVIGADTNKQNGLLDSVIDEVRIFKSVKTESEIKDIFNEFVPDEPDVPTPPAGDLVEVLYANFDGNTDDHSGRGNDGTVTGTPAYTSGVVNEALHIVNENGSTSQKAKQYVDFGKAEDLQFGTDDFSLSYWYRSDNGVSAGGAFISNKDFNSGGNVGFNIGNFNNGFRFNFTPSGSSRMDAYAMAPIDGVWHHVAVNVDRAGNLTTYLDGNKEKELKISGARGSINAGNFVVGADGYFKNGLNDAFIDELHVYRGLQKESDIASQYISERLQLAYQEAEAFYQKEHTNTLYDETAMQELQATIAAAKSAIDQGVYENAEALISKLDQALQTVKDSSDQVVAGQMLYVDFDDENATDKSGRGNNGTIQGNVSFVDGIKGKAAHIQNSNGSTMNIAEQYINFGKAEDLQFGKNDFSVGFWYKTNNGGGKEAAIISNKDWSTGNNKGFTIGNFGTSSRMNFTAVKGKRTDINNIKINDDDWHYVVMNADRDHKLSAYVDGNLFSNVDISAYYNDSIDAEDFVIGADGLKTQGLNDAFIDEVRVFSRLMTQEEIEENYLPVKLQMLVEQGEAALAEAQEQGYPQNKITTFETVIKEVKEAKETADAEQVKALIERMENAFDYFNIEKDAEFTFSVFSDVHITDNDRNSENSANFINALQDLVDLSPNTKALMVPGDITNGGGEDQYTGFYDIIDNFTPAGVPPIVALGNHDVRWLCSTADRNEPGLAIPTCKEGTSPFKERYLSRNQKYMGDVPEGQLYFDNWVDGYHFITLNTEQDLKDNAYLSQAQLEWLDKKMAEGADPEKPIFLQLHQTFKGTADHEDLDWVGEQEEQLKEIMSKYPQSVIFTGHVHNGVEMLSVYQGTWGHLVDVPCYWYKSYGDVDSQGIAYQVDVNGTDIKIRVRDFLNNKWLDQYEMNFNITDPLPKDPTDDSMDLSASDMSVTAGSTHGSDVAANVLDNDLSTMWHTEWTGSTIEQNYLLFDLKGSQMVNGLRYLPRQSGTNGTITEYRIQVSDDGKEFRTVAEGKWKPNSNWKIAEFEAQNASYVKLIALAATNTSGADKIASASEVRITHPSDIDKTVLQKLITEANALTEENYTISTWTSVTAALTEAKAVLENQSATAEEVAKAEATLSASIQALTKRADAWLIDQLRADIAKYEAMKDIFTEEEFAEMADALKHANTLFEKGDADISQQEATSADLAIIAAAVKLNKAEDTETLLTNLQQVMDIAYATLNSDEIAGVRPGKVEALKNAVAAGQDLLNEASTDRAALKSAITAIEKATMELWEIVNKEALDALIKQAEGLKGNYTEASKAELSEAVAQAKAALDDDATVQIVSEAYARLANAIANMQLEDIVNKDALANQIKIAEDIMANIDDYIASTVKGLKELLDKAKAVNADDKANQTSVDAITAALTEANMKARTKADKEALETVISEANAIDESLYTQASVMSLQGVVQEAEKVLSDEMATQEQVNAAVASVREAIDSLQKSADATPGDDAQDNNTSDKGNGEAGNTTPNNGSSTGDSTNAGALLGLLAISGCAALAFARRRKED